MRRAKTMPLAGAALALSALAATVLLLGAARADIVTGDHIRVSFNGRITPKHLPRHDLTAVSLHVAGRITPVGTKTPSGLDRVTVQVNRHARFTTHGLPRCAPKRLVGTSTREALAACRDALIGTGYLTSHIEIAKQAPFPARGRILAFNSTKRGHNSLLIHVYGRNPASISTVLSGALVPDGKPQGAFGPRIVVQMPKVKDGWGYVNGFGLTFERAYRYRGHERNLISASCPAPEDIRVVPFRAARGTFELSDGQVLERALGGHCTARH
jgi:hypothetical protein